MMQFLRNSSPSLYKVQRDEILDPDVGERLVSDNSTTETQLLKYKVRILNIQAKNLFPKFSQSYHIRIVWDSHKSTELKEVQGFVAAWSYQDTFMYKTTSLHNLEEKFLEFQCYEGPLNLIGKAKLSFKELITQGTTKHHVLMMRLEDGSQRGTIEVSIEFTLTESSTTTMREDSFSNIFTSS